MRAMVCVSVRPHVLERAAAVGRLEDADARHRGAKQVGFAGADPDDVRIRRRDGDVADARGRLILEDRLPASRRRRRSSRRRSSRSRRRSGARAAVGNGDVGRATADVGRAEILPGQTAVGRRLLHRAIGVVGRARELGVCLGWGLRGQAQTGNRDERGRETRPEHTSDHAISSMVGGQTGQPRSTLQHSRPEVRPGSDPSQPAEPRAAADP